MTGKGLLQFVLVAVLGVTCGVATAQTETNEVAGKPQSGGSEADLAKAIQNPIASMVTLPFQANWNTGIGDADRTALNLNIQPVIPFTGEKWNVISRTIIPVNSVPIGTTASEFGLGDTSLNLYFSPAKPGKVIWGVGPSVTIPTSSNAEILGSGKWSLGPSAVVFYATGNWTMGAVATQTWSLAGDNDRDDVNFFFAQWFVNYNLGHGWAVGTAPIITANWQAESGQEWTVPLGLQVSKVMRFGHQPVNLLLGYYNNLEHPDNGPEAQFRFQLNLLYP